MKLHFIKATGVFLRTLPFVALRLAVGVLFGVLTVVYFGIIGWFVFTLLDAGTISGSIGAIGVLVATLFFLAVMRLARRYVLYMVAAGHIAVIAHIVETGETPSSQIAFGTGKVKANFAGASALFVVDQMVKSVITQFNRTVISLSNFAGFVPTLGTILTVVRRAIALAATYLDEAILAYVFLHEDDDEWRAARDGVVLYGKVWKPVLGSTLLIVLGMYVVAFVGLLALTPLAGVLGSLAPTFEVLGWVVVFGIALTGYLGVLRPWVKTVVITTFLVESEGMTPDSDAMDFIASRSKTFTELMANAEAEKSDGASPDDVPTGELPHEKPT